MVEEVGRKGREKQSDLPFLNVVDGSLAEAKGYVDRREQGTEGKDQIAGHFVWNKARKEKGADVQR